MSLTFDQEVGSCGGVGASHEVSRLLKHVDLTSPFKKWHHDLPQCPGDDTPPRHGLKTNFPKPPALPFNPAPYE